MKKKLLLVGISLVLLMCLQACTTTSTSSTSKQTLAYPERMAMTIKETGAQVAILVNEKGELTFLDAEGKPLDRCSLPKSESSDPVCKGLNGDQAVVGISALPILETQGSGCITLGPNAAGHYYQYCW
jgi:hypothetical protein